MIEDTESKQPQTTEADLITLSFVHQKIGTKKFYGAPTQTLSEFRSALEMSS